MNGGRTLVTGVVLKGLIQDGSFFRNARGCFYFHKPTFQMFPLEERSRRLSAFIEQMFGVNEAEKQEYQHLITALTNHAFREGQRTEVQRLAHFDLDNMTLYVSRFDGYVCKLDAERIEKVLNGTDGIFFLDDPEWEPYEIEKPEGIRLFERIMLKSINFSCNGLLSPEEQRWLYRTWLLAQFFDSLHSTKPQILFCGEKGSGKTLASRKWLKLLLGEGGEVTALEHERADGFIATVSSQPVAVFDNVDERIGSLPDHLAQLATGSAIRRRRLYTTNEEICYRPNCWIALTSRTPKFLNGRDDVLDRTLIFQTKRLRANVPEHQLLDEVDRNRNHLWGELLEKLNQIVAFFRRNGKHTGNISFRMADFGVFVVLLGKLENQEARAVGILKSVEREQSRMLCDQEPIYDCLCEWLRNPENWDRSITSGDLCTELTAIAEKQHINWPYRNGHSLGQRLPHIIDNLSEHFEIHTRTDTAKQKNYTFHPKTESPERPEAEIPAIPEVDLSDRNEDSPEGLNH
jgi:hypothetical protein